MASCVRSGCVVYQEKEVRVYIFIFVFTLAFAVIGSILESHGMNVPGGALYGAIGGGIGILIIRELV